MQVQNSPLPLNELGELTVAIQILDIPANTFSVRYFSSYRDLFLTGPLKMPKQHHSNTEHCVTTVATRKRPPGAEGANCCHNPVYEALSNNYIPAKVHS